MREVLKRGLAACLALVGGLADADEVLSVDTLVLGGTKKGVETAEAAAKAGESVFLATSFPYLGEDLAGTLEMWDERWPSSSDLADFDYWPSRRTDGIRWIYHNDAWERLSEPGRPPSPADAVWYDNDISYRCKLRKPSKISRIEVIVFRTHFVATEGSEAVDANNSCKKAAVETSGVTAEIAGETIQLRNAGKSFEVPGDYYRGTADAISFVADVNRELSEVSLTLHRAPTADHQLVCRIWFHLSDTASAISFPSPLSVKRTFDRRLLDAGVKYLTSAPVRRMTDERTVELATRSGRMTVTAKRVVDATRLGAFRSSRDASWPSGEGVTFSRVVIASGEPPAADGMKVEHLPHSFPISHTGVTGEAYRCTMRFPMKDFTYPSLAAAEWEARERTWTPGMMDDADLLVCHDPIPVGNRPSAGVELPCWGAYDVVVVGGGTAGVPAALAAARSGAKVLLVEYLQVLGGTGTDGMILGYYDGNHCGFTTEFKEMNKKTGARFGLYPRAETWRRWCREAGVTVWLGAMGTAALVEDGKVTGVEVSTELGTGVVRAKCVIDGTGNSDIAASAGARTRFLSAAEFALQSAGQAPHRLGRGGINSDFGFIDDSSAHDLWLFGLRARAGAPNAWDIAKMPDSRERRRIVSDYMVTACDVTAKRTYPDTVVQALSRQDSHGYLTDEFRFVSEMSAEKIPSKREMRHQYRVNVPLRSLLPKGVSNLAVVGLGAGVARDVLPIIRMQADLMNMGYSVGLAAAMAVKGGDGDFRKVDVGALRVQLVRKGILPEAALEWTKDENVSSDTLVAEAVRTMADAYRGSHVVWREENRARALPLLEAAYAAAETKAARQIYAKTLGFFGSAAGVDTLVKVVSGKEKPCPLRKPGSFGGAGDSVGGFMLALGHTHDQRALKPLLARARKLGAQASVGDIRDVTLSLEALGSPEAAPVLESLLKRYGGHAVKDPSVLKPLGGYGLGPEMDGCIRELAFARALWACGDPNGFARQTLEGYAADPRGVLSAHAKAVLNNR